MVGCELSIVFLLKVFGLGYSVLVIKAYIIVIICHVYVYVQDI